MTVTNYLTLTVLSAEEEMVSIQTMTPVSPRHAPLLRNVTSQHLASQCQGESRQGKLESLR